MLALYLAALGFGSTLILASLLLGGHGGDDHGGDGGHDHDHDHDADPDHDADHDHDADPDHDADHGAAGVDKAAGDLDYGVWLPFLSLRFWTFGMASFGLAGSLLTLLSVPDAITTLVSVLVGLSFGVAAAWFFRALKRDSVSGVTSFDHVAGEEARVILTIRPGQPGKIALQTLAGRIEMLATTRDAASIEAGSQVIVAAVRDGVADVSRLPTGPQGEAWRQKSKERAQHRASHDRSEG